MPTTENSVAIFSYIGYDVRTVMVNGQPWFIAADVCKVLGLDNVSMAVRRVDPDGVSTAEVIDSLGRSQSATIIDEPSLYDMIFMSRRAEAVEFKRWITRVVLPEIRQTGSFTPAKAQREIPQDFASALREFAAEIESHEQTKAALAEAEPRAEAWDAIASAEGDYSVGDAAKILARAGIPTGPTRLFADLERLKWTYRGSDRAWRAYADRVERGYLHEKPSFHYHPGTGERVVDPPQVRVTLKGVERLRQRLHVGHLQAVTS